jgi:hypothetical protein
MRRVAAILSVAAVVLMAAGLVAQAKPSFAGEWKIPSVRCAMRDRTIDPAQMPKPHSSHPSFLIDRRSSI